MKKLKSMKILQSLLVFTLVLCLLAASVPLTLAAERKLVSVALGDVEIYEGTQYRDGFYDEDTGEWTVVSRYLYEPSYVVFYFSDGSTEESEDGGIFYEDEWQELVYTDDQSDAAWGLGEHTVTASVAGIQAEFTVTVLSSPVERVELNSDIVLSQYFSGYYAHNVDADEEYFHYDYFVKDYTVYFKDGTVAVSDKYGDVEYEGEIYFPDITTDQSFDNQWGKGKHTAAVSILGYTLDVEVEIISLPIQNILFDDPEPDIYEGTNGYEDFIYDDEDNEIGSYFFYMYDALETCTVVFEDGTTARSDESGYFSYNGIECAVSVEDDQSPENPWGLGAHKVSVTADDFETYFYVNILESPIESVKVEDVNIIEGTNQMAYDTEGFYLYNPEYTITFRDGTVIHGSEPEFTYRGRDYEITTYDSQFEGEQWELGTYTGTLTVMGFEQEYSVHIIANPFVSLEVEDITLAENTSCISNYSDFFFFDFGESYKRYFYMPAFTLTDENGEVFSVAEDEAFVYNGTEYYLDFEDNQEYGSEWTIGDYPVKAYFGELEADCTVHIVESLVADVKITKVYPAYTYDTMKVFFPVFEYTVIMKDGTEESYTFDYDSEDSGDYIIGIEIGNDWDYGDGNLLNVNIAGFEREIVFSIEEPGFAIGDVDLNGTVDITDATYIQMHLANIITLEGEALENADTDHNGNIDITDATYIQMYIANLLDSFEQE